MPEHAAKPTPEPESVSYRCTECGEIELIEGGFTMSEDNAFEAQQCMRCWTWDSEPDVGNHDTWAESRGER